MKRLIAVFVLSLLCLAMGNARSSVAASSYPDHPVRWIVGYPPGGTTDILARIIAQWLTDHLGQRFVVENKPGAGNNIGTEMVVKAPPDGYTVLLINPANTINDTLYQNLNFNFVKDIAPVAGIVQVPNVMEVPASLPVKNIAEFIAYAKANPGKVNLASSGVGTSVHLSGELFKFMTGVELVHVPYRGAAPALTDLISGRVQVMFDNLPSSVAHIQAGELRALGMTTPTRSPMFPDVPAVSEAVPGYEATAAFGMGAPKGTPPDIIAILNREINAALADPGIKAKLADLGGVPIPNTPEAFGKLIEADAAKWAKVIKAADIHVE